MDWDVEDERPRYRLCGTGFALLGLALGLLCIDGMLDLASLFTGHPAVHALREDRLWTWLVGAPITWGSLIGSLLLLGRWPEATWRRRAGLLALMNSVDLVSWFLSHNEDLGLGLGRIPHPWLRMHVTMALGWAELSLIAALAGDVSTRLGMGPARDAARAARAFAIFGALAWGFWFLGQTRWSRWPLGPRGLTPETLVAMVGSLLLLVVTSFQVTVLCILASRQCRQVVRDLNRQADGHDLLRSRSELAWEEDPWHPPASL